TAPEAIAERDVAALQALKDVLRGLVWAEEALGTSGPIDYARFLDELDGAVDATSYQLPVRPDRDEVIVADVIQARGVPWRAVAVLGLAEGEFPATLSEDPFLRDADRKGLQALGLPLDLPTASAEHEFFYETVTRPRDRLLLTRPRLADNGADWPPSTFWEEVRRLVDVEPERLTSETVPSPAQAASWPELLESLAAHPDQDDVRRWAEQAEPDLLAALDAAVGVLHLRHARGHGPHDGDLHDLTEFAAYFGPDRVWSASRLEAYRACPFWFFVGYVLKLEPRAEPTEGLDARQLGNLYHRILEHVYQAVDDPADLDQLLTALPAVAGRLLDEAPRREGFRETAWWTQTRAEIQENVRRSLVALAELPGAFAPLQHEAVFGLQDQPPLVVRDRDHDGDRDGDDVFRLRGFIDRVDRDPAGRVRIIDYKTGGPTMFTNKAVAEGKKLQLPLYALAARDALGLGEPVEGFYWHVRHAQASGFTLGGFPGTARQGRCAGGPAAALDVAVEKAWEAVRSARAGHFVPHSPDGGCPSYCPAAAFCWHRQAGFGG
ncbi:MAG: PD-(D/E)XK nuclease family protein, partial [Chloroflexi bacterium]|nr:PD-(D/E)XK nuclease family protein [Chloroflexota bacterium]